MIEKNQYKNELGYDIFEYIYDNGKLIISFENDLKLYWIFIPNNINDKNKSYKILITEENQELYTAIEHLMNAVKDNKPFFNCTDRGFKKQSNKEISNKEIYKNNTLVWKNNDGNKFSIKKEDNNFKIKFKGDLNKSDIISVPISTKKEKYFPYNITFMYMYDELLKLNQEKENVLKRVKK